MSFELIAAEEAHYPKALMCRALGLSRSGHHAFRPAGRRAARSSSSSSTCWSRRSSRAQRQVRGAAHREGAATAWAPHQQEAGGGLDGAPGAGCAPEASLADDDGLASQRADRAQPAPARLLGPAPDRVWVADTTYLPVIGGFIFLVAIIDLFSRKVVGWSVGDRLDAELSGEALRRALARRQPTARADLPLGPRLGVRSYELPRLLAEAGALQSMSRKGDCWDNAVAESFFSTLEFEGPSTTTWRYVADGEPETVHLHRALLQSDQAAFIQRLQEPERDRGRLARWCAGGINRVSTESGQAHISAFGE